ncbi:MAG TPA: type II toxin-antitoxin system Phd/YefM family antitoxin [Candidatus Sulfotelmatobacter sp.]
MRKIKGILPVPDDKLKWGEALLRLWEEMSPRSFTRLNDEVLSREASRSKVQYWMDRAGVFEKAIPNEMARRALSALTRGKIRFSQTNGDLRLSDGWLEGLRRFPAPPDGASDEECQEWAHQVAVVADHHVDDKSVPQAWQLQTAKARFSEVFRLAHREGPQRILRQGKDGVIMIAEEQYNRLVGKAHQPRNLVEFFRRSPLVGVDLSIERDDDRGRDIEL